MTCNTVTKSRTLLIGKQVDPLSGSGVGPDDVDESARQAVWRNNGESETACRHAVEICSPETVPACTPAALWVLLDLVEAAVRAGRTAEANAHVADVHRSGVADLSPRLAMVATAATGTTAPAASFREAFDTALATPGASRWPFAQVRIRLAYAERLSRAQSASDARHQLRNALDTFERLGAAPWAARARAELGASGTPTTHPAPGPTATLPPGQRLPSARHQLTSSTTRRTRRASTRRRPNRHEHRDSTGVRSRRRRSRRNPTARGCPGSASTCVRTVPVSSATAAVRSEQVWFASERGSSAGRLRTVRGWAMDSSDRAPASGLLVVRSSHDRVRRVADVLWPVCRSDRECGRSADAVSRWAPLASFGPGHRVFEGNVRWISQGRPHHTPTPRP